MVRMIVVHADRCVGCLSCELACAVEHSESRDLAGAMRESPCPRSRIKVGTSSGFAVPLQCRQCASAPCVAVCPVDALRRKDTDSPVLLDEETCIGCKMCVMVCPFGLIDLDPQRKKAVKCDQCWERFCRGELPACVEACPTGALESKTLRRVGEDKRRAYLVSIEKSLKEEAL
jgi:carbon-monoxide dehydrogenase iron sulfur subunit